MTSLMEDNYDISNTLTHDIRMGLLLLALFLMIAVTSVCRLALPIVATGETQIAKLPH